MLSGLEDLPYPGISSWYIFNDNTAAQKYQKISSAVPIEGSTYTENVRTWSKKRSKTKNLSANLLGTENLFDSRFFYVLKSWRSRYVLRSWTLSDFRFQMSKKPRTTFENVERSSRIQGPRWAMSSFIFSAPVHIGRVPKFSVHGPQFQGRG